MVSPHILIDQERFSSWADAYRTGPVAARLSGVTRAPDEVFLACKHVSQHCFILESVPDSGEFGRYTFIGYDPILELACKDGVLTVRGGLDWNGPVDSPASAIAKVLAENAAPHVPDLPPFTGGLAGYFGFDYVRYGEPSLRLDAVDEEGFRDVDLMLFDKVVAFDHRSGDVYLIVSARLDAPVENYQRALRRIDDMARLVQTGRADAPAPLRTRGGFEALFDRAGFVAAVERAKEHIRAGDIFQVVLSNRLRVDAEGSLFDTYRLMRSTNPSPYLFYFASEQLELAGASPETLVRLTGDEIVTYPLAGTRPRGSTDEEDAWLEAELLADEKELAEHTMLVDLARNDVGKLAELGSVSVYDYLRVLRFSRVMHLGSVVTGRARPDVSAVDVVGAVLPAGTLSGAPKIRACQILNDLEGVKRGVYGGAIGYLSTCGDLDTCIAIRLAYKKGGKVYVRAGAGIVADSEPQREYQETLDKMRAVLDALPAAAEPDVAGGDAAEGEVPEGDVSEPDVSEPDVFEGEVPGPDVPEPDVPEGDVSEPDVPETDVPETDVHEDGLSEPGPGESDASQPFLPDTDVQASSPADPDRAEGPA